MAGVGIRRCKVCKIPLAGSRLWGMCADCRPAQCSNCGVTLVKRKLCSCNTVLDCRAGVKRKGTLKCHHCAFGKVAKSNTDPTLRVPTTGITSWKI